jgi:CspA family cold shock protein
MATGTVKWFNPLKKFGFIIPDDQSEKDVFVHISAVEAAGLRTLPDGCRIEFTLAPDKKGKLSATELRVVD